MGTQQHPDGWVNDFCTNTIDLLVRNAVTWIPTTEMQIFEISAGYFNVFRVFSCGGYQAHWHGAIHAVNDINIP